NEGTHSRFNGGEILRLLSGNKFLKYPEEQDALADSEKGNPDTWRRYLNVRKTQNVRHHGTCEEPEEEDVSEEDKNSDDVDQHRDQSRGGRPSNTTQGSDKTRVGTDDTVRTDNGGKNVQIIDWDQTEGSLDSEVCESTKLVVRKKFFVTFLICLLTFSVYIGSAIYSAGIMDVMQQFGVSQVAATAGLTLFVAGYGIGPMIWSPMSEIPQVGRNPVYIGTLLVFVVFQFGVIYAKNFAMMLIFRFLTGFFGSPVLATGGASLADMYAPKKRAYAIGIWGMAAVSGPVLGPLVGGFAAESKGWTWTIWELTWLSGFALVVLFLLLPETSSANILYRRRRRLAKASGVDNLRSEPELEADEMTTKDKINMALILPFSLTFSEPILFCLNLYIALIYGLLYVWFESFAIVFVEIHGFSLGLEGLAFLEPKFDESGNIKPEIRLQPAFVGAFCIPICLFWFGWTSKESIHWIVPIIGSAFFSIGAFLLFNSVLNYIGDAYPKVAASAFAGNDFMRSCFGAGFPLFANAMFKDLGVPWASSTLAFISVAFIPIPFILYRWGEKIRMKSKRARHDI
ncbi:multidrug resistance protein, partial [Botrytis cinerea]